MEGCACSLINFTQVASGERGISGWGNGGQDRGCGHGGGWTATCEQFLSKQLVRAGDLPDISLNEQLKEGEKEEEGDHK